ncbi:MAG: NmrA/HSCARG family protein [Pseudomonadota bacterium]
MKKCILVAGATGSQGGAVLRHLQGLGHELRALTRDPSSAKARALSDAGINVVAGDMRNSTSLTAAMKDVDSVFAVQDFYAPGVGYAGEVEQGRNLAEAAAKAGVTHFVQSTMAATDDPGDVEHFRSKFEIERIVDGLGLPRTFVGTAWFIDNVVNPKTGGGMTFPALSGTLRRDTPFHILALDDLGAAVAAILGDSEGHVGRRQDLASEVTTITKMKADYRRVAGRAPKRWWMPNTMLRFAAPDFAAQLRWHVRKGWAHDTIPLERLIRQPTTFAAYLEKRGNVVL